jgi:hypothetical protein
MIHAGSDEEFLFVAEDRATGNQTGRARESNT